MKIFGEHQPNTLSQFYTIAKTAEYAALMADGHLGYDMPIGGVAAYKNQVSVTGVGFDIACGNAAIRTDLSTEKFKKFIGLDLEPLALAIEDTISFGVGGTNKAADAPTNHPLFEDAAWAALPSSINIHNLKGKARSQLGTVGSGNHYVDVFSDEQDRIWVGVHFGSRGFGYTIAQAFIRMHAMQAVKRGRQGAAFFDLDSPGGDAYWTLMNLAGKYAYAGREWVARKVVDLIGAKEEELVHNHHNFAWKETHFGQDLVVVRKGATPAFNFQKGFVGGSMGDNSVILRGMPSAASADALYSTVHGAGRVMSRTEAKGKVHRKTGHVISEGRVTSEMMDDWLSEKGVVLRGGGLDESPHAYRRLDSVLEAQGDTIEILHTLKPLVVVMAP